jgi:hypothetical protein
MTVTKPIPIRFENKFIDRLDTEAGKMGRNRAALIRFCVSLFVDHVEKHGSSTMPPDWDQLVSELRKKGPGVAQAMAMMNVKRSGKRG